MLIPGVETGIEAAGQGRYQSRKRVRLTISVHPDTDIALVDLCRRFTLPRGQVIDRMVDAMFRAYDTGTNHCVTGAQCPHNRKDLPAVL